jgi:hypothetical protein
MPTRVPMLKRSREGSVPNELISDGSPKYENGDPDENEKECGPGDLRNFGSVTSYDRKEEGSECGKSRECSGDKIEKLS